MKTMATEVKELRLTQLVLDKTVQMRASVSTTAVQDYADSMAQGDVFPPVVTFGRLGFKTWVADGFHRVLAARKCGLKTIRVELHDGGKREAMLYAMRANAQHGVRRTNADKQRAVEICLHDREWVKWADSEIARRCAVSGPLVGRLRETIGNSAERTLRTYVTTTGQIRTRTVEPRHVRENNPLIQLPTCPTCGRTLPN